MSLAPVEDPFQVKAFICRVLERYLSYLTISGLLCRTTLNLEPGTNNHKEYLYV
jgi:hypothetical protein